MRIFTAHTRLGSAPLLVPERFSWAALFFGPFWLLGHRAWIAGIIGLFLVLAAGFVPAPIRPEASVALSVGFGLFGHDLRRWSLTRRGFLLAHVVTGRDQDEAMARLLGARPDLLQVATR